jgi:Secretion system C-terminal sorting domain
MRSIIVLVYCLLAFCFSCLATQKFVSPSGNDITGNGSSGFPWKSIQKAANTAVPGDTVFIRAGTYFEQVTMNVSGTASNFITFINYPGEAVVVNGNATNTITILLKIDGRNFIRVAGIEWKNARGNLSCGILIQNGSSNIEILHNKISVIDYSTSPGVPVFSNTDNSNPIVVSGNNATTACSNILVRGNEIFNCRPGFSEALAFVGNVDGFIADSNYIHNISNIGIDIAGGTGRSANPANDFARNGVVSNNTVDSCVSPIASSACIYVDGGKNSVIYGNILSRGFRGVAINCETLGKTADNILVRDNIAYHNREAGFTIGNDEYPVRKGTVNKCQLLNNTSYGNFTFDNNSGWCEIAIFHNTGCRIENNILFPTNNIGNRKALIFAGTVASFDTLNYNLYFSSTGVVSFFNYNNYYGSLGAFASGTGYETAGLFGDPKFADTSAHNFHISPASAAIDKGNPAYNPAASIKDFYGGVRKTGLAVDAGADEGDIVTAILSPGTAGTIVLKVFPNPATQDVTIETANPLVKQVQWWNAGGRLVKEVPMDNNTATISVSDLSKGLWLLVGLDKKGRMLGIAKLVLE